MIDTNGTGSLYIHNGYAYDINVKGFNFPVLRTDYKLKQGIFNTTLNVVLGQNIALENEVTVHIYSCRLLSGDECSTCRNLAFIDPALSCRWCNGSCTYSESCPVELCPTIIDENYKNGTVIRNENGSIIQEEDGKIINKENDTIICKGNSTIIFMENGTVIRNENGSIIQEEDGKIISKENDTISRKENGTIIRNDTIIRKESDTINREENEEPLSNVTLLITAITATIGFFLLLFMIVFIIKRLSIHYRKKRIHQREKESQHQEEENIYLRPSIVETGITSIEENTVAVLKRHNVYIDRDNLTIGKPLGSGQFGLVYKGFLNTLIPGENAKVVAIKTVKNGADSCIKEMIDEAFLMMNFKHPNVLTELGISVSELRHPMIIIPFMKNGDLLSYIRDETNELTLKLLLEFAIDIAKGMRYLASRKFVHRDLAARNCLLDEEFVAKIGDFGLSRDIYSSDYYTSSDNKKKLPFKWMSPESIEVGIYTEKSDVWSFGILLWELITRGAIPYPGVENWQVLDFLKRGVRLPHPLCSPKCLYQIIQKCWQNQADSRPTFDEILNELSAILESNRQTEEYTTATPTDYEYDYAVNVSNSREYIDYGSSIDAISSANYLTLIADSDSNEKKSEDNEYLEMKVVVK